MTKTLSGVQPKIVKMLLLLRITSQGTLLLANVERHFVSNVKRKTMFRLLVLKLKSGLQKKLVIQKMLLG